VAAIEEMNNSVEIILPANRWCRRQAMASPDG
jgi:hypothetical protein